MCVCLWETLIRPSHFLSPSFYISLYLSLTSLSLYIYLYIHILLESCNVEFFFEISLKSQEE